MEEKKQKFFSYLRNQKNRTPPSPLSQLPRTSQSVTTSSPIRSSVPFRHSPSPDRLGGDYLRGSGEISLNESSRIEELEISVQEKNDIIQRLSADLEKTGHQIDQMSRKLTDLHNNNSFNDNTLASQILKLEDTIRLKDQHLAEKTRMLENTIGTLQRENTTDTFDSRNLKRLEEENEDLNDQIIRLEDQLTKARMDFADNTEKGDMIQKEYEVFQTSKEAEITELNSKLNEYISKKNTQQKVEQEAMAKLEKENAELLRKLEKQNESYAELEDEKTKLSAQLEDEIQYLLDEKNVMQARHMELYRAQEKEIHDQLASRDGEIEVLKTENYQLNSRLLEMNNRTFSASDEEFQSAIESLQTTIEEKNYENYELRDELEKTMNLSSTETLEFDKVQKENEHLKQTLDESLYHEQEYMTIKTKYIQLEKANKLLELENVRCAELSMEIISLRDKNTHLTSNLTSLNEEKDELTRLLNDQNDKIKSEYVTFAAQNEKLVLEKEKSETQFEAILNNLQQSSKEKEDRLGNKISQLDSEVVRLNALIEASQKSAEEKIGQLEAKLRLESEKCEIIRTEKFLLENVKDEMDVKLNNMQTEAEMFYKTTSEETNILQKQLDDEKENLFLQISKLNTSNDILKTSNEDQQNIIHALNEKLSSMQDELAERTHKTTEQCAEIDMLQSRLHTVDMAQTEREQILEARQRASVIEFDELRNSLRELNGTNDFLRKKNENFEDEVRVLQEVKSGLESNLVEMETLRDDLINQLESLKVEVVNQKAALPDLQVQLSDAVVLYQNMTSEHKLMTSRAESAEMELSSHKTEQLKQANNMVQLTDEVSKLTDDKIRLKTENERLVTDVEKYQNELHQFQAQFDTVNNELGSHKRAHDELHGKHDELLKEQIEKIEELEVLSGELQTRNAELDRAVTKINMLQSSNDHLQSQVEDYNEMQEKYNENDVEVNKLIVIKSELEEKVEKLERERMQDVSEIEKLQISVNEKTRFVSEKEGLIAQLESSFTGLSAEFSQNELMAEELDELKSRMKSEEEILELKELVLQVDNQKDEIHLLTQQLEEIQAELEVSRKSKDDLIEKLNTAESSISQAQSDNKQLAEEVVAQYNRFQDQNIKMKDRISNEYEVVIRNMEKNFENEKETMMENFEEKYNGVAQSLGAKNQEVINQVNIIRQENEKYKLTISSLEDEINLYNTEQSKRDEEMDMVQQDLADLIPVSEELKDENDNLKEEVDSLRKQIDEGEVERIEMLSHIESENKHNQLLKIDIKKLNSDIEAKFEYEKKLTGEISVLRDSVEKLGREVTDYRSMNSSIITSNTNATQYIPIRPRLRPTSIDQTTDSVVGTIINNSVMTEGSLPDSEIDEMDSRDIENLRLREELESVKAELVRIQSASAMETGSSIMEGPLDDTFESIDRTARVGNKINYEELIEKLEKEREEQLMAKNDQLEALEKNRQIEKGQASEREERLRSRLKELNDELDKAQGFNENGPLIPPETVTIEEVCHLRGQNEFLQKQAEDFADELEKTINSEDELSKENISLQKQLVDLKHLGPKDFDEIHEKIFDENEQLRKALLKINNKVKEFTKIINKDKNTSLDMSQLEQYPIEVDEEMDIEEGVAVTEQIVNLLDQMINQGKEVSLTSFGSAENVTQEKNEEKNEFIGYGELSVLKPNLSILEEVGTLKNEVSELKAERVRLNECVSAIIAENCANMDEQTRKIFEMTQSQHFAERNRKDEKIRRLEDLIEAARDNVSSQFQIILKENYEFKDRIQHLERDLDQKVHFIEQQSKEQDTERCQQEEKIRVLQSALAKLRNESRTKLHETEFEVTHYKGRQVPLQEKLDKVERELQRERENRDNIQTDYNLLCQKLEISEGENSSLKGEKREILSAKDLLSEELRLAYARISELEIFIDKIKLGNQSRTKSTTSLSEITYSLSKSTSNLKPFQDETKLNDTTSLSLHNIIMEGTPQPSAAEAHHHYVNLIDDLTEKSKIIEMLEEEIDQLRTELEEVKDRAVGTNPIQNYGSHNTSSRPITPQKKSVHSLLEDLSERENQIFEKNEEVFGLEDQILKLKSDNQRLKEKLSQVLNEKFNVTEDIENCTIETDPASTEYRTLRPSDSWDREEWLATKNNLADMIEKTQMQEKIIEKLNEQIKLLKNNRDFSIQSSSRELEGDDLIQYSLSDSELSDLDISTPQASLTASPNKSAHNQNRSGSNRPNSFVNEENPVFVEDEMRSSNNLNKSRHDGSYHSAPNRSRISERSSRSSRSADRSKIRLESDLAEKQQEIKNLEKFVEELNTELISSQNKLTDFIEKSNATRESQKREYDSWRRDQMTKMISPESYAQLNEKLLETRSQMDDINQERNLIIDEFEKTKNKLRQMHIEKNELKESCEHLKDEIRSRDENIDRLQDQNIHEYEHEITQLRDELDRLHLEFQDQNQLASTVDKLQTELDALRQVYAEANQTILSLRQGQTNLKKDAAENLLRLEEEITQNRELCSRIDEFEDEARNRTVALKSARDQLRIENEKMHKEIQKSNSKIINHEILQKEQQETITKLFKEIEDYKQELDEIQNTSRSSESSLAKSQSEKLKEINVLCERLSSITADRDNKAEQLSSLKTRCSELESQLDENLKSYDVSGRGEELIRRMQSELDQQEALDEKIMSHFDLNLSSQFPSRSTDKLQSLVNRVCHDGEIVFNLSKSMLHKNNSESEKYHEMENIMRRFESQIEQEKLVNHDLQESLRREQQQIHDQERRADADKKTIEYLQAQQAKASRELGDKCVEVSRCLAEIGVIKQELIDKTNLLHESEEIIDKLRADAEKMRQEFSNYEHLISHTKYETEVMRHHSNYLELQLELTERTDENKKMKIDLSRTKTENQQLKSDLENAKHKFDTFIEHNSSSDLESHLRQCKQAEEAERSLNKQLNQKLRIEVDIVANLKNELSDVKFKLQQVGDCHSDEISTFSKRIEDLTSKLEKSEVMVDKVNQDRDLQAEVRIDAESKLSAGILREKRLIEKMHRLEMKIIEPTDIEARTNERTSLQTIRSGLELARQQLSSLSARLQVATVRCDTSEIEICRNELTDQHRNLTLIARTLNSTRSSKRAQETGILENRMREQLHALEESTNRISAMELSNYTEEFSKLREINTNLQNQIETLKIEKNSNQNQLENYRSKLVKLELELERKENIDSVSQTSSLVRKQQKTYERYARAESARKALVYQKKYLLLIVGGFQETEASTLRLISKMGGNSNEIVPRKSNPIQRFRAAALVCIAINRLAFLRKKWQKTIIRSRSSSKEVISSTLSNGHRQSPRPLIEYKY